MGNRLIRLWPDHSCAYIADQLGKTRNAIIGRAHRTPGCNRKRNPPKVTRQPKAERPVRKIRKPLIADTPALPEAPKSPVKRGRRTPMGDLPHVKSCQWPQGHPGDADFHFCGAKPLPGLPYCDTHYSVAYRKYRPLDEYRKEIAA